MDSLIKCKFIKDKRGVYIAMKALEIDDRIIFLDRIYDITKIEREGEALWMHFISIADGEDYSVPFYEFKVLQTLDNELADIATYIIKEDM